MWGYAFEAATYIRNRILSVRVDALLKPPYKLWTNKVPCMRHWRRWGCKAYVHIPKVQRPKNFSPILKTVNTVAVRFDSYTGKH